MIKPKLLLLCASLLLDTASAETLRPNSFYTTTLSELNRVATLVFIRHDANTFLRTVLEGGTLISGDLPTRVRIVTKLWDVESFKIPGDSTLYWAIASEIED